jgi:hypothetical protein
MRGEKPGTLPRSGGKPPAGREVEPPGPVRTVKPAAALVILSLFVPFFVLGRDD